MISADGERWGKYQTDRTIHGLCLRLDVDYLGDFLQLEPDGTLREEEFHTEEGRIVVSYGEMGRSQRHNNSYRVCTHR